MIKNLICQSCGMPLESEEDLSTNADGSENREYCAYCYEDGKFTEPDITLGQMLDKVESLMVEMEVPEDTIDKLKEVITKLKRWN